MLERVVSGRFNGVEHGQAATAEKFDVGSQGPINHLDQGQTPEEQAASSSDQFFHERDVPFVEPALDDVRLGEIVGRERVQGNIDASFLEIARYILPKICQLQRRAGVIGKALPLAITISAQIQHDATDRVRRVNTIIDNSFPCRVALHRLVLAESTEQIRKRLDGNILRAYGFAKRNQDGM